MAEAALETLSERGIAIETWVNHGPPTNAQCIGTTEGWQGDLAGAPGYHADLLVDYGVRWVWTGEEIVDRIAVDVANPRHRHSRSHVLVEPYTLRDGGNVRRFYRYGGLGGNTPVLDDLPVQLSDDNLDELARAGGYAVVYQHLGVRRIRPGFGTGAYDAVGDEWFRPAELVALRNLSQRHSDGEIWVVPTTQLLRYRDAHAALQWHAHQEADGEVIVISSPAEGAAGRDELVGLTFWCDSPETTRIYVETAHGRELVTTVRANPADETGRRSLTIVAADAAVARCG
jgi:hypothetical protein